MFTAITFAGIPTAIELSGMSFVTTAFAPMVTLFPIVIPPIIFAPLDNMTLSPIRGMPDVPTPIVTP